MEMANFSDLDNGTVVDLSLNSPTPLYLNQNHICNVGDKVTVHGEIFQVKDDIYEWHLKTPDDSIYELPNTKEPSFVTSTQGIYVLTLQTEEGEAQLFFTAS